MKSIWLILLVSFIACKSLHNFDNKEVPFNTKYFTGIIKYKYTYESNVLNADSLKRIKPNKSLFRYDNNDYQSQFIGKDTLTYFYSGKLNKCLSETNSKKDYDCEDYGMLTDSIIYFKIYNTDETIMGYKCKIIEYQTKYFWNKYYVSRDLKISPNTYIRHLAYNWSFYGTKTNGGLILKLEHRFKNYIMKGEAVEIKKYNDTFIANEIAQNKIEEICQRNK
ncbi:MAG: hypothetical protein IPG12_04105 [Saprospiraceae bacterium]|nr:hypothetical protein [Saprospiraceae bacterium]